MEGFQPFPLPLGNKPWVAGASLDFPMMGLPPMIGMAVPHVVSIDVELQLTPTYTAVPTTFGNNAAIKTMQVYDGVKNWLGGTVGFNALRGFERAENGKPLLPDPLTGGGTGNPRYIRRRFYWNPPTLYGQPSDSAYNCAYLANAGNVNILCGALTDISADTTAATGTVSVTANIVKYFNKCIFPGYYLRQLMAISSGLQISQKALYAVMAFLNSTSFDAFAAGDVGDVSLDTGIDQPLRPTNASILTAAFQADFKLGQFDSPIGDPRNATFDVAPRIVNLGSPTAIQAQPLDFQPILWCPQDTRLTKIGCFVPATLTPTISGANTTTQALIGRFQPMTAVERGQQLALAMVKLGGRGYRDWGMRLADDTKDIHSPLAEFFPWQARLNKLPF